MSEALCFGLVVHVLAFVSHPCSFKSQLTSWQQYLGPSAPQIAVLFVLFIANTLALLFMGLLLVHNIWTLGANVTTIESWEIERHDSLVRRAKRNGGYLDGPDGIRVRIRHQEFPFDIGFVKNIYQGMGTSPLWWLWPLAPTPSNESGLSFETNGFDGDVSCQIRGRLSLIVRRRALASTGSRSNA